ncbi:rab effector MyRIP isoform X1 [Electrophorus electricus]|uniref:rab effector MyRIP isoform X1 n=2 Tax=Electrophorus electricus TaxID=8005 RepID=UPI0015D07E47|nr:rab effector MyRIP isoform X1 [Electrophorus electricus]
MGRKLDLSGLTDDEAEHVLRVVQRDMKLRKKEEERLSELKQELEEEGARCLLLAGRRCFNQQCCIRCCRPFGFLRNLRRDCLDCRYNVCGACCTYSQRQGGYVCTVCQKSRFLRTQSLEWYYNNVKSRFKRFGSAKVLKTLYKKHIIERGALSELPEGSAPEGSNENDGSACGSDSTLYRQSEGHSMADTLTVALRVAEEAIEEAITKAESYRDSLEKQNEARYLRDHREELIDELATTIVQKIIHRGKRSEMQAEYDFVWSQAQNSGLLSPISASSMHLSAQDTHATAQHSNLAQACLKNTWRSQSAFSLTSDESPDKAPEADETAGGAEPGEEPHIQLYSSLRRESRASVPGWKSVDRLDNSNASSVLQSPDGNWMALQTSQHSRPSLLTKRKSLVFNVLEKESGVVSAYDELGSDSEAGEQGGWGMALLQIRRRLSDETYYTDPQHEPEWPCAPLRQPATSPSSGQYTNTETLNSDSEASAEPPGQACEPTCNYPQEGRKGPAEPHPPYAPYLPYRHPPAVTVSSDTLDVNFNPRVRGDSSEGEEQSEQIRRFRRRRRSKRELDEHSCAHSALYTTATAENSALLLNAMILRRQQSQEIHPHFNYQTPDTVTPPYLLTSGAMMPEPDYQDTALNSMANSPLTQHQAETSKIGPSNQGLKFSASTGNDTLDQQLKSKLSELVGQISREDMTSSEDEPIRKVGKRWDDEEREKGSERPRQMERPSDGQKESKSEGKTEKRNTESASEAWLERDPNNAAQHVERETDRTRARQHELYRQVERDQARNVEKQREIKVQVNREMEMPRERERWVKREQARRAEEDGEVESTGGGRSGAAEGALQTLAHVSGPGARPHMRERRAGSVASYAAPTREESEEEDSEADEPTGARARRAVMRRSKSERGPDTRPQEREMKRTRSAVTLADSAPCRLEEQTPPTEKYSAASLCSITTEVLKVLNATEELIGEAEGKVQNLSESPAGTPLSSGPDSKKLDQHLTKMEENVYLAAGAVYGLEGALSELEDCARNISSCTTETELAFLEDQVATAAAQVQQSELQISDIEARISALKNAGLNVSTCSRFSKFKPKPKPQTLDYSRQLRRKLPAPPATEKESNPKL